MPGELPVFLRAVEFGLRLAAPKSVDALNGTHLNPIIGENSRLLARRFAAVNARDGVADRGHKKPVPSSNPKYPARTAATTKAASSGLDLYA